MNKDEILQKSRQIQKDEGLEYIENQGRKIGFYAFCTIFIFIVIVDSFFSRQKNPTFYAVSALFWVFMASEAIPKFKFTHRKSCLITIIAGYIATIFNLINFLIATLR
ncbi:MAG: DUF6442 family protein [Sarcina sp.]